MALLWVLCLTALLSLLLLAFVSTVSERGRFSGASVQQSEDAARVALAMVEADIQSEIRAGSFPVRSEVGTAWEVLYPATPWSAAPARAPELPPNLLRQSRRGAPSYPADLRVAGASVYPRAAAFSPVVRACACGAGSPARNASGITPARWNAPALLPLREAGGRDFAPADSGDSGGSVWRWEAPDWVVQAKDGRCFSEWSPEARGQGAVRFAFQIYDEGGLLDLNVAGAFSGQLPRGAAARRGSLRLADLQEVGFSQSQVLSLVRWRDAAVWEQPDGPPFWNRQLNFCFDPRSHSGFLRVWGREGACNRAFVSRSALLRGVLSLAGSAQERAALRNTLQFVTHFTRALEQPSHRFGFLDPGDSGAPPRWVRPRIIPPAGNQEDALAPMRVAAGLPAGDLRALLRLPYEMALGNYRGGNDAWGNRARLGLVDNPGGDAQDAINPGFLETRVRVPFVRADGSRANPGEPLVLRRFPLSRLSWLTWKGPSACLDPGDPLYRAEGTPEAIRQAFGLEWIRDEGLGYLGGVIPPLPPDQVGFGLWKYDHSISGGRVPPGRIGCLEEVAADAREPDFFELLKAAIAVGSLGKAAAPDHSGLEGWAHDPSVLAQLRDKNPDHQIWEIGANLIDQWDADSFPTLISAGGQNPDPTGAIRFVPQFTARGVEDLPYLYRWHWRAVENAVDPPFPRLQPEVPVEITDRIAQFDADGFRPGTISLVAIPELWNPHAPSPVRRDVPLQIRIVAVGEDSQGPAPEGTLLRPFFPLLSEHWRQLLYSGSETDRRGHFAAWPCGTFAFSLGTARNSTKTLFHDRRFSSSYEFYDPTARATDYHSGRLATARWAEPSSYLFWANAPAGDADTKYAIEGFAYWRLNLASFDANPADAAAPSAFRGYGYRIGADPAARVDAPVWFIPADGRVRGRSVFPPGPGILPPQPLLELRNSELTFQLPPDADGLFREPTALCRPGLPEGSQLAFGADNFFRGPPYHGKLTDPDGNDWVGISLGEVPAQFIAAQRLVSAPSLTRQGTPVKTDSTGMLSDRGTVWRFFQVPVNLVGQRSWNMLTVRLQIQNPASGKWVTYQERSLRMSGKSPPDRQPYQGQWNAVPVPGRREFTHSAPNSPLWSEGTGPLGWAFPFLTCADPRTVRFGMHQRFAYNWPNAVRARADAAPRQPPVRLDPAGAGVTDRPGEGCDLGQDGVVSAVGMGPAQFGLGWVSDKTVIEQDPGILRAAWENSTRWWAVRSLVQPPSLNANDIGWISRLGNPSSASAPSPAPASRGFPHFWEDYSHDPGTVESTETGLFQYWGDALRDGALSENVAPDAQHPNRQAVADADDVIRRAAGAYHSLGGPDALAGLPLAQPWTASGGPGGGADPNPARPLILNRPFLSVGEMGYAFRGGPWKQLDFFTPESGDAALLDVFCIQEPPVGTPLVAGRVNLNTRQEPVLRALLSGVLKDECAPERVFTAGPEGEAAKIARALVGRTSGRVPGQGPLAGNGELVGKLVGRNLPLPGEGKVPDCYTAISTPSGPLSGALYTSVAPETVTAPLRSPDIEPGAGHVAWTFAGFAAELDAALGLGRDSQNQRLREAAVRALADCGQVRVWNLMVDLIVQTGRYPPDAAGPEDFIVQGQARHWLHLAIDRWTGAVVDRQLERVEE